MGRKKVIDVFDYRSIKKYTFGVINKQYKVLTDRECLDYLVKWNLDKNLKIFTFSIDGPFENHDEERIIANMFQCEEVIAALNYSSYLGEESNHKATVTIEIEEVPCTILSMDFFDKIYDSGIVLTDGTIRKCFEEYIDDVVVADELRKMLLVEESDNYTLFPENERDEFIFRLFKHLCIGGILNQYEDNMVPYLTMTKNLYKDIICVRKTGNQKTTTIMSKVYQIVYKVNGQLVIPTDKLNNQDFLYLVLNLTSKDLTLISHVW